MSDSVKKGKSPEKQKQAGNHNPTEETKDMVVRMSAMGATKVSIARRLKIDPKTLNTNYHEELTTKLDYVMAVATDNIVDKVMDGDLECSQFVLTHKGGWSKTHRVETNVEVPLIKRKVLKQDGTIGDSE